YGPEARRQRRDRAIRRAVGGSRASDRPTHRVDRIIAANHGGAYRGPALGRRGSCGMGNVGRCVDRDTRVAVSLAMSAFPRTVPPGALRTAWLAIPVPRPMQHLWSCPSGVYRTRPGVSARHLRRSEVLTQAPLVNTTTVATAPELAVAAERAQQMLFRHPVL